MCMVELPYPDGAIGLVRASRRREAGIGCWHPSLRRSLGALSTLDRYGGARRTTSRRLRHLAPDRGHRQDRESGCLVKHDSDDDRQSVTGRPVESGSLDAGGAGTDRGRLRRDPAAQGDDRRHLPGLVPCVEARPGRIRVRPLRPGDGARLRWLRRQHAADPQEAGARARPPRTRHSAAGRDGQRRPAVPRHVGRDGFRNDYYGAYYGGQQLQLVFLSTLPYRQTRPIIAATLTTLQLKG